MTHHHSGSVFGAFLGGAIIGGALALLFAPRSGAQTREMIRDYVGDEMDMIKDKADDAREYVEDEIKKYKGRARRAANELGGIVEDAKSCVESEIEQVKRAMRR